MVVVVGALATTTNRHSVVGVGVVIAAVRIAIGWPGFVGRGGRHIGPALSNTAIAIHRPCRDIILLLVGIVSSAFSFEKISL